MGYEINCKNCSNRFNPNNYDQCPKCKTSPDRGDNRPLRVAKVGTDEYGLTQDLEKLDLSSRLLIEAQNRTTQAVRSLAITFVAAPIVSIALVIGIALSFASGQIGVVVFSAVIALAVCVYLLAIAVSALQKSKIPDSFNRRN